MFWFESRKYGTVVHPGKAFIGHKNMQKMAFFIVTAVKTSNLTHHRVGYLFVCFLLRNIASVTSFKTIEYHVWMGIHTTLAPHPAIIYYVCILYQS
jgi:hypothetical protein